MADHAVAHFQNDKGVKDIEIGVKEFMCCGASAPFDHPHVFLDMGSDQDIICPYCSTHFKYADDLETKETRPAGCLFVEEPA
ncbi:MAG: zinc-finger domain-containing protein [Rhizobiaceae bacterium]|nr:zinc-finger domain-containing protein [Rhizobiaceae bacterium]